MTNWRRIKAWVAVIALSGAVMHGGQLQAPRYAERVDVERILVDVRVLDHAGQPVLGLIADDFRVKIGGTPVAVQSITWVGGVDSNDAAGRSTAVERSGPMDGEVAGRLIIFLFQKDLEPSRIIGLMRMLVEAQGVLDGLTPYDRVAVLSFDSHLKIWVDFTNDRDRLLRVLTHGILFEDPAPTARGVACFASQTARIRRMLARRTRSKRRFTLSPTHCTTCRVRNRSSSSAMASAASAGQAFRWSMATARRETRWLLRGHQCSHST